jgi:hypothetical protein
MTPPPETPEDAIQRLAQLSALDYEKVRADESKKLGPGFRTSTLDSLVEDARKALGNSTAIDEDKDLVSLLLSKGVELFHDNEDNAYARLSIHNHLEVHAIVSPGFKKLINAVYFDETKTIANTQEVKEAIDTLIGLAVHQGSEKEVHCRIALHDEKYYIDLCNENWQVVELDSAGWRILDESPVMFRRTSTMLPLPIPVHNGDFQKLWRYINISPEDRPFVTTWMVDSFRADTKFPVLEIIGQQGSGKSNCQETIKQLVDPNKLDLRPFPRTSDDIWVAAKNSHCLSFENVSSISAVYQDTLCMLSTGAGNAKRSLYTNDDESIITACNPVMINGIAPVVTASDLADRTVSIRLPTIAPSQRIESTELEKGFKDDLPEILGGLLDIFSGALSEVESIEISEKPRMISYAILGEAISKRFNLGWSFNDDYLKMRKGLLLEAVRDNACMMSVVKMLKKEGGVFVGTFGELVKKLEDGYLPKVKGADWPKTPKALSNLLSRFIPGLSAMGISVTRETRKSPGWPVRLEMTKHSDQADD